MVASIRLRLSHKTVLSGQLAQLPDLARVARIKSRSGQEGAPPSAIAHRQFHTITRKPLAVASHSAECGRLYSNNKEGTIS